MDDDNAFLNVPEDYENDEQCLRRSQDSSIVNARGRNLLETCTALNLRILNGRIVGDLEGKKTCSHYNGSVVTGGDNSNKGCLGSPMNNFMSSWKFRRHYKKTINKLFL